MHMGQHSLVPEPPVSPGTCISTCHAHARPTGQTNIHSKIHIYLTRTTMLSFLRHAHTHIPQRDNDTHSYVPPRHTTPPSPYPATPGPLPTLLTSSHVTPSTQRPYSTTPTHPRPSLSLPLREPLHYHIILPLHSDGPRRNC